MISSIDVWRFFRALLLGSVGGDVFDAVGVSDAWCSCGLDLIFRIFRRGLGELPVKVGFSGVGCGAWSAWGWSCLGDPEWMG